MKRLLLGLACAITASSFAAETLTFEGTGSGAQITIGGHHTGQVFAGKLKFNETSLGHIQTICVDLDHFLSNNQSYTVSILNSNTLAANLKAAGNIIAQAFSLANTNTKNAALQMAVWEAVYDNGASADFAHGNFKTTGGTTAGMLSDAVAYYSFRTTAGNSKYFKATDKYNKGQNQMTAVPEPTTMAVLAIGALALRRRRKLSA